MEDDLSSPGGFHPSATLAGAIVETVRVPLIVLDAGLTVCQANASFYRHFRVEPEETIGRRIYALGDGQWNIPELRVQLKKILTHHTVLKDFEVQHTFERLGQRIVLLNAQRIDELQLILLAIEDITEEKTIQEDLRGSKELLQLFIEHAPTSLAMFDRDMRYLLASRRWRSDYDLGDRPLQGLSHYEVFPEIPEHWREAHRRGLAGETLRADCDRFVRANGSVQWVHWELRPWFDATGKIGGIVIFTEDVTARKQAETALAEREERYRVLAELSPEALLVNANGYYVYVNSAAARLIGATSPEEIIGKTPFELHEPEYHQRLSERIRLVLEEGGIAPQIEFRWKRMDGSTVDVEVIAGPTLWGGVAAVQVLARDITERKRIEQQLRESELRFRQLADAMPQLVWTANPNGEVDYYNNRYREFMDLSQHSDGRWEWAPVLHPEDIAMTASAWQTAYRTGSTYQTEHRVQRADGSFAWFLSRAIPIRDSDGQIVKWYGTATDIDELKTAELAIEEARKQAVEASRAKSEFVANMSHEIRTPMTVFLLALEQLLQLKTDPACRQLLEIADKSARALRELVDDILDFSRIEARCVRLVDEPFALRACVHDVVEIFALPAQRKGLRLATTLAEDLPDFMFGDETRLKQVLINLIGNAVKFTPAGEIGVSVCRQGEMLEFAVADTGVGIPDNKRQLIFESFTQADSSFQRQHGGSGLGLAICKGLVQLMGGQITGRNRDGGGCLFTFTIPLKSTAEEQIASTGTGEEEPRPARKSARILLVEDDPLIRDVIIIALDHHGWQTEFVGTGSEAVAKCQREHFDIILMDLQMPGMNGLEATRMIRRREEEGGKLTVIIGLTAHVGAKVAEECLQAGMNLVLNKPIKLNDLFAAIDAHLENRASP